MSQTNSQRSLSLKGQQEQLLIDKFKQRQEQTSLEEALVYLKLREFQCESKKALIFSKKKERGIDGTLNKDGPAGFRKLEVNKPESKLVNGWLRGEKHKYAGATGYSDFLKKHESAEKKMVTSYHQKFRQAEEEMRKTRSKSTVTIDMSHPRQSLEKIGSLKEDASRERQNRNMYIQYAGVRLDQTTKNFFKQAEKMNEEGLIMKLGAFNNIIADKELNINVDLGNMKGKSFSVAEVISTKKRDALLDYHQMITSSNGKDPAQKNSYQKLINKNNKDGKQLIFRKTCLQQASNPLILMNSKQIKKDLTHNQKKCLQNLTSYGNFYQNMEKVMNLEFLSKRKFSHSDLESSKKKKLILENQNYL